MTPEAVIRHGRAIFFEHAGTPMYPSTIYEDPVSSWETLYAHPGAGDQAWQELVRALIRLGWQPPRGM